MFFTKTEIFNYKMFQSYKSKWNISNFKFYTHVCTSCCDRIINARARCAPNSLSMLASSTWPNRFGGENNHIPGDLSMKIFTCIHLFTAGMCTLSWRTNEIFIFIFDVHQGGGNGTSHESMSFDSYKHHRKIWI